MRLTLPKFEQLVHAFLYQFEKPMDFLRYRLKTRFGMLGPVLLLPFRGYGNSESVFLKGRVLEDKGIEKAGDYDSMWHDFRMMVRRFRSNEIPGVQVRASFPISDGNHVRSEVTTDEEGYFEFRFSGLDIRNHYELWHQIDLELMDKVVPEQDEVRAAGHVLIPPRATDFGVISDIDDTIIQTGATNLLKMIRITFLNNARSRLPFEGVAGFYRALQGGQTGFSKNPFFYVSSSPWNLYDLLMDFLDVHRIPVGPLLLRDLGLDRSKLIGIAHAKHKSEHILQILDTYKAFPFILIGDSGQEDPEIYYHAVLEHPERVRTIYIRDVVMGARHDQVLEIAHKVRELGIDMLLVKDTEAAALHALENGLIHPDSMRDIRNEQFKDHELRL